jgi:hypothetical protein
VLSVRRAGWRGPQGKPRRAAAVKRIDVDFRRLPKRSCPIRPRAVTGWRRRTPVPRP